jgi:predicted RNase H-like nuclease
MIRPPRHGPNLPYTLVAGVIPTAVGWLVASAKLQGVTIAPESPRVLDSFMDVIDEKPAISVIGLFAPVGLIDKPEDGERTCDADARALLGTDMGTAIHSAPSRRELEQVAAMAHAVDVETVELARRYVEVDREMAPYRQRTVFEVHPELTFYQLNEDQPLERHLRSTQGRRDRRSLLESHIPSVERILDARVPGIRPSQLIEATACLWTARRILARAITRLPTDPEWDSRGLRMEIVR